MLIVPESQLIALDRLSHSSGWWGPVFVCVSGITSKHRYLASTADRTDVILCDMVASEMGILSRLREVILGAERRNIKLGPGPIICSLQPIDSLRPRKLKTAAPYSFTHVTGRKGEYISLGSGIVTNELFMTFVQNMAPGTADKNMSNVFDVIKTHLIPS